jgi:hypothetical protein
MDDLKPLILHILNTITEELDIPQMLKRGIMKPVLKKNKDRQNPANAVMIFLAKHSLCDAHACLCAFLKSLFATISCDFRGFALPFGIPAFLHQYNDQVAETHEDILALWQKYFQDLSNPDFKQDFDYEKYDLSHIQNAYLVYAISVVLTNTLHFCSTRLICHHYLVISLALSS